MMNTGAWNFYAIGLYGEPEMSIVAELNHRNMLSYFIAIILARPSCGRDASLYT